MTRRRTAADRIARGASAEVRRRASRTADWIAASPTRRGSAGRLAVVITAVAVGVLVVLHRWPWLMWPLSGWWAVKAWRAGRSEAAEAEPEVVEEVPKETPEASDEEVYAATLAWLHQAIGDRNGVHLADLLANAHAHGMLKELDVAAFRARLEGWGIAVRQQLKVGGRNRPGVRRADLPPAPSPAEAEPDLLSPLPAV